MSDSTKPQGFSGEPSVRPSVPAHARVATVTGDCTVVAAVGEIDFKSYHQMQKLLTNQIAAGHAKLVLDLDGVTFCDSSGLGMFVSVHRRASAADGWLRLARPSHQLRRILGVTNLDRLLGAYETVDAAITGVKQ